MDKFGHEKLRKRDIVIKRGADPISLGIRRNDEFLSEDELRYLQTKAVYADKMESARISAPPAPPNHVHDEDEDEPILSGVSPDLLNWFWMLLLSHPDTRGIRSEPTEDGGFKVTISKSNQGFLRELVKAVMALDETRKKARKHS